MSALTRYTQKIFGSTATAGQMAEFGSLAAGAPQTYSGSSITPTIVQTLSNYLTGWFGAVIGANSPTIEDMNALFFLVTYQLATLFQDGISQYDTGTTYYIGSCVRSGLLVYQSLTDTNIGNALSSTHWQLLNSAVGGSSASYAVLSTDSFLTANATSADLTFTLPAAASTPIGTKITIKKTDGSANTVTIACNGGDFEPDIDGASTYALTAQYQYVTLILQAGIGQWFITSAGT